LALAALVVALLALPAVAFAADGQISGKVTQAVGGADVAGAQVCAENELDFSCTLSEADGDYEITGLATGSYFVSFEASEANPFVVFQEYPIEVPVTSAMTTSGINAAVIKGGVIAGSLTDAATLQPLVGFEVCSWWEQGEEFEGCAFTDIGGSFKLLGLHPGTHELEIFPSEVGYQTQIVHGVPLSAGVTRNLEASLVRAKARISGHVYAAVGDAPLVGVSVCAILAKTGETRACVHTDVAGAYEFFPVPTGIWKIVFSPEPAEVEFEEGVLPDAWPTQFWNQKTTLAAAEGMNVQGDGFTDIDGLLGPGPSSGQSSSGGSSTPSTPSATRPPLTPPVVGPKPVSKLHCPKGKVKKRVNGKPRCVTRHKARKHHKKHRAHR
jgi:Carboxypeptidase regulatory-like domain